MRHISLLNRKLPERAEACRGVFCFGEDPGPDKRRAGATNVFDLVYMICINWKALR